ALYRVVFDIAMEAAIAMGSLVNRTSLPIFARVAGLPGELKAALLWSLQRLASVVCPFMVALMLLAAPLTALLHDSRGHSYAAGALPLRILAAAGILRVTSQLIAPVLLAAGKPGTAAWLSTAALLLLVLGIAAVGASFPARTGLVAIACVWLAVYPPLIVWNVRYLGRHWRIGIGELLRPFLLPAAAIAAMLALARTLALLAPAGAPGFHIATVLMAMLLAYGLLLLVGRLRPRVGA
ncbi:MAG: oligosaccharide flippase family protein, partial [Acetobacteraceae bacterium]